MTYDGGGRSLIPNRLRSNFPDKCHFTGKNCWCDESARDFASV